MPTSGPWTTTRSRVVNRTTDATGARSDATATGRTGRHRWWPDLVGVTVVCVIILIGYFDVPFAGQTFSMAAYQPGVDGCGSPTGACHLIGRDDPRVDPAATVTQFQPWEHVTHRLLSAGEVPLWTPYQAIGAPLAANMQSAPFDPMLLPLHLHPTPWVEDLTSLVALLLVGVGAYLAARVLRLSPLAATVAGVVYGLSGWFFTYSNAQLFRAYVFLPLIVACVEWTLRSTRRVPVVLLGLSVSWLILTGFPEITFIVLAAVGIFSAVRLGFGVDRRSRVRDAFRLGCGLALGLALAAPLLLIFLEYVPRSLNTHSVAGSVATDPPTALINWLMPKLSPSPLADYARTFHAVPSSYAYTRSWVGVGAVIVAGTALLHSRAMRRYAGWPLLAVGALVGIQIYGGPLVGWTRHLPVWSQVLWPRWATPVLALVVALLAGIGLQAMLDGEFVRRRLPAVLAGLAVAVAVVLLIARRDLALGHDVSVLGGWPLALLIAGGVTAAASILGHQRAAVAVAAVIVLELLLLAPHGFYTPRTDQYPARDWIRFVSSKTRDGTRLFSPDAVLYPNSAGVYGLYDPRMVDALDVERYWDYVRAFISPGITTLHLFATSAAETGPNVTANPMFDILGVRYVLYRTRCTRAADPTCTVLPLDPPAEARQQYPLVYRSGDITVFENTHAAPRAFVVTDVHRVTNAQAALDYLRHGEPRFPNRATQVVHKNPRQLAVVEAPAGAAPRLGRCATTPGARTRIRSYGASSVTIDVDSRCPGLLVLSDSYYPGWSASINGHPTRIYPTDAALRGVTIPAGHSTVAFDYRPSSFRWGLLIAALAVAALVGVVVASGLGGRRRRPRRGRGDRQAAWERAPGAWGTWIRTGTGRSL